MGHDVCQLRHFFTVSSFAGQGEYLPFIAVFYLLISAENKSSGSNKNIRLPSKLSFLRDLFIPALTPTPLPPGEGLFRVQALASVSYKIVVWKEAYSLGYARSSLTQPTPAKLVEYVFVLFRG